MTIEIFITLSLCAFTIELIDATLGMGYGTTLVPLLLILGFNPLKVVPAVVISQFLSDFLVSLLHHKFGNVNFSWNSLNTRTALVLGLSGVLAPIMSSMLAIRLPKFYLKAYISLTVILAGLFLIIKKSIGKMTTKKMLTLAFVAGFNKGLTGGGYGPIVTSSQILLGVNEKNAIAVTSLAEGITCIMAVISYAIYGLIDLNFTFYLTLGAMLATPIAAYLVKKAESEWLRIGVGLLCLLLGLITLIETIF